MERIVFIIVSFGYRFQGEISANSMKRLQFHEFFTTFFYLIHIFEKFLILVFLEVLFTKFQEGILANWRWMKMLQSFLFSIRIAKVYHI